jgi:NAD(P)-dependent dehydrogenase (short-subunit alcohol dehydrogenase family)
VSELPSVPPDPTFEGRWALILGASSGFGGVTARHLARLGLNIFGVHLDRRATLANVEKIRSDIEGTGREAWFVNINAADDALRAQALDDFIAHVGVEKAEGCVKILMHSLAFGTLKPFVGDDPDACMTRKNLEMTLDVMANSLVYWTQDCVARGLLGEGSSIYAMTSSGGSRIIPTYGGVSAAKSALESHIRQLAFELGPRGIRANSIRAGVTDTPALRKIPGNDRLLDEAARKNPFGRLTTPEDVALAIGAIAGPGGRFISGNVIGCDGGEDVVG